jgi:hypothetical protein
VNDLDLSLLDPGFAVLARGSVNPARPSTEPDRSNPVECIDISGLPAGRYVLRTTGFNVMDGPQRFALAWAIETAVT